jgi:hypothetical protein
VHVESRQPVKNIGGIDKPDPVELDVLAGREVPETTIEITGDAGQPAKLVARQHTIGDGHRVARRLGAIIGKDGGLR